MKIENVNSQISVSEQITVADVKTLVDQGVEVLVCNRPDGEAKDQTPYADIKTEAEKLDLEIHLIAFASAGVTTELSEEFSKLVKTDKRIHAYCRTGTRSKMLCKAANISSDRTASNSSKKVKSVLDEAKYDVVIIGAGSAGIATASSLRKRNKKIRISLIDPSGDHYYQPGWTMVGGGVFDAKSTHRMTKDLIPNGVDWIQQTVSSFSPSKNSVVLDNGSTVHYQQLVVAPGLKLDWAGVEGLEDTLGKNGVTSNYRYDLAPYTWELVQNMKGGKALFTQPPMPIKCAGAPQKALYLSASQWHKTGQLKDIDIEFHNAGGVLFGVEAYVPALMSYIKKYDAELKFMHTLVKVDGNQKTAWFKVNKSGEDEKIIETKFDFLHVCPPQCAPDFIKSSELSDGAGWLDVDPGSLQHKKYPNIWGAGDVMNTPNAKTMAAARKQAPVVAQNIANTFANKDTTATYDGYGSCPLTVERGKIVLAEFAYGGKLTPSFPKWFNDGTKPTSFAWFLKASMLPSVYWHAMLKGREWLAGPS